MVLLIVLCGVIISICMGLRQTLGLYQRPMMLEASLQKTVQWYLDHPKWLGMDPQAAA